MEERVGVIEIALPSGARVRVDAFVNEKAGSPWEFAPETRDLLIKKVGPLSLTTIALKNGIITPSRQSTRRRTAAARLACGVLTRLRERRQEAIGPAVDVVFG
jgi:hypothetical protein